MRITTSFNLMFYLKTRIVVIAVLASTALFFTACREDDVEPEYVGNWFQKTLPDFDGVSRRSAIAFTIDGFGYAGLGYSSSQERLKDFWEYNPQQLFWTQKAAFGGSARQDAVAFSIGGKGYVGTGYDGEYRADFWEYDRAGNTWTEVEPLPAGSGNPERQYATAFVVNNKAYVGLGFNGNYLQDFHEYTPGADGGSWKQITSFIGGKRQGASAFVVNGKAYVGFGRGNTGVTHQDLWEFNPEGSPAWVSKTELEDYPRANAVALSLNNKGYVIGGAGASSLRDVWEYDPATDTWTQKTNFEGGARSFAIGFAIDGVIYYGTGQSGSYLDDFWGFDPSVAQEDND